MMFKCAVRSERGVGQRRQLQDSPLGTRALKRIHFSSVACGECTGSNVKINDLSTSKVSAPSMPSLLKILG